MGSGGRRRSNLPGNLSGTLTAGTWTSRESGGSSTRRRGKRRFVDVKLSGLRTERGTLSDDARSSHAHE
ncbi:MAG: hypothetical protein DHS20C19_28610 [Acidimicrobiales bacterium]|nr:MAG: hypothetical protein DHS20C19_28610 [Acidimicrobiales bacterium]